MARGSRPCNALRWSLTVILASSLSWHLPAPCSLRAARALPRCRQRASAPGPTRPIGAPGRARLQRPGGAGRAAGGAAGGGAPAPGALSVSASGRLGYLEGVFRPDSRGVGKVWRRSPWVQRYSPGDKQHARKATPALVTAHWSGERWEFRLEGAPVASVAGWSGDEAIRVEEISWPEAEGEAWQDLDFPPHAAVLGKFLPKSLQWHRGASLRWGNPGSAGEHFALWSCKEGGSVPAPDPADLVQASGIGDCWLVAVIDAVASVRPDHIAGLLKCEQPPGNDGGEAGFQTLAPDGRYVWRLYDGFDWVDVAVDDTLPMTEQGPALVPGELGLAEGKDGPSWMDFKAELLNSWKEVKQAAGSPDDAPFGTIDAALAMLVGVGERASQHGNGFERTLVIYQADEDIKAAMLSIKSGIEQIQANPALILAHVDLPSRLDRVWALAKGLLPSLIGTRRKVWITADGLPSDGSSSLSCMLGTPGARHPCALWGVLLVKAFAKLHKSVEALHAGQPDLAFRSLLGPTRFLQFSASRSPTGEMAWVSADGLHKCSSSEELFDLFYQWHHSEQPAAITCTTMAVLGVTSLHDPPHAWSVRQLARDPSRVLLKDPLGQEPYWLQWENFVTHIFSFQVKMFQ